MLERIAYRQRDGVATDGDDGDARVVAVDVADLPGAEGRKSFFRGFTDGVCVVFINRDFFSLFSKPAYLRTSKYAVGRRMKFQAAFIPVPVKAASFICPDAATLSQHSAFQSVASIIFRHYALHHSQRSPATVSWQTGATFAQMVCFKQPIGLSFGAVLLSGYRPLGTIRSQVARPAMRSTRLSIAGDCGNVHGPAGAGDNINAPPIWRDRVTTGYLAMIVESQAGFEISPMRLTGFRACSRRRASSRQWRYVTLSPAGRSHFD